MKIIRLRLSNLASIAGEHTLCFEQEPLKHAGLIAITGNTGAGKTTLLDAICLALFNEIPRLQQAHRTKTSSDASGEDIALHSTLNILRRGCVQGFAEVEFIAQNGKHYLARWEVKRARLKPGGKLQEVQRMLRCVTDNQLISERTNECNKTIIELLGLNFKQFTRAVMLAQSDVCAFLKAKESERADLLEYLTNSDIYSRIGRASFEANKQASAQVELIERKIGDQPVLTDDERQALQQQLQQVQQQISQQRIEQQRIEQQINWYSEQAQLEQQLISQRQECQLAQQQWQQFEPHQQLLAQLDQFEPIRDALIQRQQQAAQTVQLQHSLQTTRRQLEELQQQQGAQQHILSRHQQQLAHSQQQQQQCKAPIRQAQQLEHQLASLSRQRAQQQQQLARLTAEISPNLQQQQHLQQQLAALDTQLQALEQCLHDTHLVALFDAEPQSTVQGVQHAAQLRGQLNQLDPGLLAQPPSQHQHILLELKQQHALFVAQYQQVEQLEHAIKDSEQQLAKYDKQLQVCERLDDQLTLWKQLAQQQAVIQQQQAQDQHQLSQQALKLQQAQAAVQQAEQSLNTLQQLAEEHRLLTSQHVTALRKQLQPNHPCMVCGSASHPYYDSHTLLTALNQQFEQPLQQAREAVQQARQQERQQHRQLAQREAALQQQQQQLQQLQEQQQQVFERIGHISTAFYQRLQSNLTLTFANERLHRVRSQLHGDKKDCQLGLSLRQQHLKQWQQLGRQLQHMQQFIEKFDALSQLEQHLIRPLGEPWHSRWLTDWPGVQQQLTEQLQTRLQASQQQKKYLQQQQKIQQDIAYFTLLLAQQQKQQAELQQHYAASAQEQQQLSSQLELVFSKQAAPLQVSSSQDWQTQLEHQVSQHALQLSQSEKAQQALHNEHIRLSGQLEHAQSEQRKLEHLTQATQQQIDDWQAHHPHISSNQLEQLLGISSVQKQQLQAQQQQLQRRLLQSDNTLAIYQQQASQLLARKPELGLATLQLSLDELAQRLKQLDESCTSLKARQLQDQQLQAQVSHYAVMLEQAKAEHHRWNKLCRVIGDAQGARFKNLAQQYHLQLLVDMANQQLSSLSTRYELRCLKDSLGLGIVDHDMNDEVRSVLSLSGGESFLVSLALALGIAQMASGTTKLESLFIDEGFGTLDQNCLHIVMDALDRLQSQGRKVILISHIQEMHERIPVKIQVIPQGSGASRIEVVG